MQLSIHTIKTDEYEYSIASIASDWESLVLQKQRHAKQVVLVLTLLLVYREQTISSYAL